MMGLPYYHPLAIIVMVIGILIGVSIILALVSYIRSFIVQMRNTSDDIDLMMKLRDFRKEMRDEQIAYFHLEAKKRREKLRREHEEEDW